MAGHNDQTIIIKRIKKVAAGHHGGAWKVAYADFVTAMMAFFLLLWLLNVTTDIERKGIADYFAPASVSKSESGSGGVFGGQSITSPGAQISDSSPPGASKAMPEPDESEEGRKESPGAGQPSGPNSTTGDVDSGASDKNIPDAIANLKAENPDAAASANAADKKGESKEEDKNKSAEEKAREEAEKKRIEEENFKKAENALKEAIESVPGMKALAKNLIIDSTPEGLRIQIVDRDGYSLFPSGGARLVDKSRQLVTLVGMVIAKLPNKINVTGHTDSKPFSGLSHTTNWELSSARAYSSAEVMMGAGVNENRLVAVIGKADKEPLVKNNPEDQQNRRISIVLLRRSIVEELEKQEAAPPAPASPADAPKPALPASPQAQPIR